MAVRLLANAEIADCCAMSVGRKRGADVTEDKAGLTRPFVEGSMGMIHSLANGHKSFPKERLEVFCGGRILQLDNFRCLTGLGWPGFGKMKLWRQDEGQKACTAAFVKAIGEGSGSPISFDEIMAVGRVTIDVAERLRG